MRSILIISLLFVFENVFSQAASNYDIPGELTITGSNIWVRSEPTNGDVVMKLNDGDRCKILDEGRFEFIRGSAHYWYKVVYKSDTGWVFGSQTDKKSGIHLLSASNKNQLWDQFKNDRIEICRNECENESEEGKCIINGFNMIMDNDKIEAGQMILHYEREGPTSYQYQINSSFDDQFYLINELVAQEGAAGISNFDNFYIGFQDQNGYSLPNKSFDGMPVEVFSKNQDEYFLLAFKEFRNVIMYYSGYYNIYLVNTKTKTIQLISQKLGEVLGGQMMDENDEGFSYAYRSSIKFNSQNFGFELTKYFKKRISDGWIVLDNPQTEQYQWDQTNRRFTVK